MTRGGGGGGGGGATDAPPDRRGRGGSSSCSSSANELLGEPPRRALLRVRTDMVGSELRRLSSYQLLGIDSVGAARSSEHRAIVPHSPPGVNDWEIGDGVVW